MLPNASILVSADLITINSALNFNTEESTDDTILCNIISNDLIISGLYIKITIRTETDITEYDLFISKIIINGPVELELELDNSDQYISAEEGHITISGNLEINIDTVINVDGTQIVLHGDFILESIYEKIDIWWDKTEGTVRIESTSAARIKDFLVEINMDDGSWLKIGWSSFKLTEDSYIIFEKDNDQNSLEIGGGGSRITSFAFVGVLKGNYTEMNIGSIYFDGGGYFSVSWMKTPENKTIFIDANVTFDYLLALSEINLIYGDLAAYVEGILVQGQWILDYRNDYLSTEIGGFVEIVNIAIGEPPESTEPNPYNPDQSMVSSPVLQTNYIYAAGLVKITFYNGTLRLWMINGTLKMGLFGLEAHGTLWVYINFTTGEIYGEFGVNGHLSIFGIYVDFDVDGYFYLEGDWLVIVVRVSFSISMIMGMSFNIDTITIGLTAFVSGTGGASAEIRINLKTGQMSLKYNAAVHATVLITYIHGYGEDANLNFGDLDIHIGLFDLDARYAQIWVTVIVTMSSSLPGMNIQLGGIHGTVPFELIIRDIVINNRNESNPWTLSIDSIIANGDVKLWGQMLGFGIDEINILATAEAEINGFTMVGGNLSSEFDPNSGSIEMDGIDFIFTIDTITIDAGTVSVYYDFLLPSDMDVTLDFEGSSINIDTIDFDYCLEMGEKNGVLSIDIPEIDIILGNLNIVYSTRYYSNPLEITGSGSTISITDIDINIDGLEDIIDATVTIDEILFEGSSFSLILYSEYNDKSLSVESAGAISIIGLDSNFYINLAAEEFKDFIPAALQMEIEFSISLETVVFSWDASLTAYDNGVVEADCELSLSVIGLSISTEGAEICLTELDLDVEDGHITIIPGEDGSTVYEFEGDIYVYASWDASGENITGGGELTADGEVYVHVENNSEGNVTLVEVRCDGETNANISLSGFSEFIGEWSFDLTDYHGNGLLEFRIDFIAREIYMANLQPDATWEVFSFSLFGGFIKADIETFQGDLTLGNITPDLDIIGSYSSVIQALMQLANLNFSLDGMLDPDNWTLDSLNGYETMFGFSFSSDPGGLENIIGGDISVSFIHIKELYCTPGASGEFDVSVNENGNLRLSLTCSEGYTEIEGTIDLGIAELQWSLNSEKEAVDLPIGDIITFIDNIVDGEWDEIEADSLSDLASWIKYYGHEFDVLIDDFYWTFNEFIINLIEKAWDKLPDWLKNLLGDFIDEINDDASCFLAGTNIEMADGSLKSIENIVIGDQVVSYDAENDEWKTGTVTDVFHHTPEEMTDYYLILNDELCVTPNHPIFSNNKWVEAGKLIIGDTCNGHVITSIEEVYKHVPTYNFEVSPYHTYNVVWGENTRSIVHNANSVSSESEAQQLLGEAKKFVTNDKTFSCFLEDTKIMMADNTTIDIEDIEVGDTLQSYDSISGEWKTGVVTEVLHHAPEEMGDYYLVIKAYDRDNILRTDFEKDGAKDINYGLTDSDILVDSSPNELVETEILRVTPNHPIFIKSGYYPSLYNNDNGGSGGYSGGGYSGGGGSNNNNGDDDDDNAWGDKSCFLAETKIAMKDGSLKNIEEIEIGDELQSYDSTSDEWKTGIVTEIFHHMPEEMTDHYLILNNDLKITPNHPIYVNNKWINAGELKTGDIFGGNIITSIQKIYQQVPTYNFEVEPYHTYNVVWGENANSIVHNAAVAEAQEATAAVASTKYVIKPDAGLKTKVKLSTEAMEIENGIVEVVPRNVVTDDGKIVEANEYSQTVNQINSIDVYKNNNLIASNLGSSSAVTTVVTNSVSSSSSSSNNGGSDDDDDDCCFPAGTLVTMADGSYKTIENVEVGDFVLSYDIDLKEMVPCRVREIVSPVRKGVYSINDGLIRPTDDHPIYTRKPDGTSGWAAIDPVHAKEGYLMAPLQLEEGDQVFTLKNGWVTVDSIEYVLGDIQTFNLEDVSGESNFFANDVLVHNAIDCADSSESSSSSSSSSSSGSQNSSSGGSTTYSISSNNIQKLDPIQPGGKYIPSSVNLLFNSSRSFLEGYTNNNPVNNPVGNDNGVWITADMLYEGMFFDGKVITSIDKVYRTVWPNDFKGSYNIKVEPYGTYKVVWGETSSIVHHNESLGDIDTAEYEGQSFIDDENTNDNDGNPDPEWPDWTVQPPQRDYIWDYGDGNLGFGEYPIHNYSPIGLMYEPSDYGLATGTLIITPYNEDDSDSESYTSVSYAAISEGDTQSISPGEINNDDNNRNIEIGPEIDIEDEGPVYSYVAVEDLKKGSIIKAYNNLDGSLVNATVSNIDKYVVNKGYVSITYRTSYLKDRYAHDIIDLRLSLLLNHLIIARLQPIKVNGEFKPASMVQIGDYLQTIGGLEVMVSSVDFIEEIVVVYDLDIVCKEEIITQNLSFFANGILVSSEREVLDDLNKYEEDSEAEVTFNSYEFGMYEENYKLFDQSNALSKSQMLKNNFVEILKTIVKMFPRLADILIFANILKQTQESDENIDKTEDNDQIPVEEGTADNSNDEQTSSYATTNTDEIDEQNQIITTSYQESYEYELKERYEITRDIAGGTSTISYYVRLYIIDRDENGEIINVGADETKISIQVDERSSPYYSSNKILVTSPYDYNTYDVSFTVHF